MAHKSKKERVGDVLGLGRAGDVTDTVGPARPHESDAEHRHERMREGADEVTPGTAAPRRHSGATGIDMGAGGEGTDLE
jgi:hypothetical protein